MNFLGQFNYYAICVPIYNNQLIFEVRSPYIAQPLEISFPGGRIEEGETPYEAAVRELQEEIGVDVVRKLFDIEPIVTPFNSVIFSYAVEVDISKLKTNTFEVLETFLVPIEHFSKPYKTANVDVILSPNEDFPYELIPGGRNYPWKRGTYEVLFYKWKDYIIWGITARIAHRTWEIISNSQKLKNRCIQGG